MRKFWNVGQQPSLAMGCSSEFFAESASRGYERATCGHGSLSLRGMLRGDGAKARKGSRSNGLETASHSATTRLPASVGNIKARTKRQIAELFILQATNLANWLSSH